MLRPALAVFAVLVVFEIVHASEPKPLWEINGVGADSDHGLSWLSYSPDGQAIAAVTVRETRGDRPEFHYQLGVWNASDQKERFHADLGSGRCSQWGDEFASFPAEDAILTGGQELMVRDLRDGKKVSTQPTGGMADFAVWSVPDLKEAFFLRRDPLRYGLPIEVFYRSPDNINNPYAGSFRRGWGYSMPGNDQTTIPSPREGMKSEVVAMNFDRTQLVASFRDESLESKARHALVLYDIKTMDRLELVPVAESASPNSALVSAMAFARNGRSLVTGGEDGSISLWDVNEIGSIWKPRAILDKVSDHRVFAITFSRDWRLIAAVTWDKTKPNLLMLDGETGKLLHALHLESQLRAVAFSPDGRTLLTGSVDGKIRAWDVARLLRGNSNN